MPTLQELINEHSKQTVINIIGDGPSTRVFPFQFLPSGLTIGLNYTWKFFTSNIQITIHPNCIPSEVEQFQKTKWLTKIKKSEKNWQVLERNSLINKLYLFNNLDNWSALPARISDDSSLYCGRGVHTTAMHLASILGHPDGCIVNLVGIDCHRLGGDHSGTGGHIQPHQFKITQVLKEYFFYLVKCRELLEKHYKVKFFNLSRLCGEGECREDDYVRQREQAGLKPYNEPILIETNNRVTPLVTDFLE